MHSIRSCRTKKEISMIDEDGNHDLNKSTIYKNMIRSITTNIDDGSDDIQDNSFEHSSFKKLKRNERKNVARITKTDHGNADKIFENFVTVEKVKTSEDSHFIKECLKKHFVFSNLTRTDTKAIVDKMFFCTIEDNEFLFKQGDNASSYFIIAHGCIDIIIDDITKKTLTKGDAFGELALMYNVPRSASARAYNNCGFWAIDRLTFRKTIKEMAEREFTENRKFIENVEFFSTLTPEQKDAIAGVCVTENHPKGSVLVNEGDPASSFHIIKEGTVCIIQKGVEIRQMVAGESFGEQALYYKTTRQCSVKAMEDVKCLSLGREILNQILGNQFQLIVFRNLQKWAYSKSPMMSKLTKIQIEKLVEKAQYVYRKQNEVVYEKGSKYSNKFIIVLDGAIKTSNTKEIFARKGELWGDSYLLTANSNLTVKEAIVMESDGILAQITHEILTSCIGGNLEDVVKKNESSHEIRMKSLISSAKKLGANLKLQDLISCGSAGTGMFGSVYLVKAKGNDILFALKCISKSVAIQKSIESHLLQEKSVLEVLNFPFLLQYIRTFKDDHFVYFLTEYIKGVELFDALRDMPLLDTYSSQFYAGQLILCLEYLHGKGIIYRDLKPENVMIDDEGYIKMIDMGTAKFVKAKSGTFGKTFTILGTPHYMAPEIISGKGYNCYVDLWSLGILLYEFMCGRVPYGEEADDPYEIYEEVMTSPLIYPSFLKDKKVRKLMDKLLNKVPEARLGGSYSALKAHNWFDNFDWEKLMDRELKPPYIPPAAKFTLSADKLREMDSKGKKITQIIAEDLAKNPMLKMTKEIKAEAKNPNWDEEF